MVEVEPMKRAFTPWAVSLMVAATSISVGQAAPRERSTPFRALNVFSEVYGYIQREYVEAVEPSKLVYAAIAGMARALDPHSEFLPPAELARFRRETRGGLVGVGMEIGLRDEELMVISVLSGAPADEAGIVGGEAIRQIDGIRTRRMSIGRSARALRGEAGTVVELEMIGRDGRARPEVLKRRFVEVDSVTGKLIRKGIAHLRIRAFQRETSVQLAAQLQRLQTKAGGALAGVILDLRHNAGGLVSEAIEVADLFLVDGQIVSMRGRTSSASKTWTAGPLGTYADVPLVVAANGATASAAEIVVGALQSNRRAVVVGTRTFGKGSVQRVIELSDGAGLKLTVAHYFTPDGHSIQGRGIEPDLRVPPRPRAPRRPPAVLPREADLDGRLDNPHGGAMPTRAPEPDPVLARALEILRVSDVLRRRP
jgi:carboxyl-terminal processing protease